MGNASRNYQLIKYLKKIGSTYSHQCEKLGEDIKHATKKGILELIP
jgi:hypothetical protein